MGLCILSIQFDETSGNSFESRVPVGKGKIAAQWPGRRAPFRYIYPYLVCSLSIANAAKPVLLIDDGTSEDLTLKHRPAEAE